MKQAWETMVAYKLIWLRVLGFIVVPMATTFLTVSQQIDLDVKWPTMGLFARIGFWIGIAMPGVGALMAFIDKSLAHKELEQEKKKSDATSMWIKNNPSGGL